MKITSLETWPVTMPLAEPYTIAYETIDACTNVFMRIETDRGPVGHGCAAPDAGVTGETPESVLRACQEIITPLLVKADPLRIAVITEKLKPIIAEHPSVVAMVDMALYDIPRLEYLPYHVGVSDIVSVIKRGNIVSGNSCS